MRWRAVAVLAFVLGIVYPSGICAATGEHDWLISPEEAALAPTEDDGIRSRSLSDAGPEIDIVKPSEGEVVPSPAEILIRFLPKTVTIDLTSLKVTLLKFIPIDLTDRMKLPAACCGELH